MTQFNTLNEAREAFRSVRRDAEDDFGIYLPGVSSFTPQRWMSKSRGMSIAMDEMRRSPRRAFDAQPALGTDPNSGIPWFMLNYVNPKVYEWLFAPVEGAEIYGEERQGDWTTVTAMFPVVEHAGEVSSYGDYANNGETTLNTNFPQRQNYLYQAIKQYGELAVARAGEARINWVSELDASAANNMRRFENFIYFFGVNGLQNYGGLNDPNLPASLSPAVKAYGGTAWFVGNVLKATPNEVYSDILTLYTSAVNNTDGLITEKSKLKLGMGPGLATALKAANSFGVNTRELLEENLPNLEIMTATQFNQVSASNPQGIAAGNMMQMFAEELEGQQTCFAAFSEKMRSHPIIREMSAFRQKVTGGAWGTVIRMPVAFQSMVGL